MFTLKIKKTMLLSALLIGTFFFTEQLSARDFKIGWYNNENILNLPLCSGNGENVILQQRTWVDDLVSGNYINEWAFLNESANRGLDVLLDLNRNEILNNDPLLYDHIEGFVNYAKNNSQLLSWHMFDEPELQPALPISRLESIYNYVKNLDSSHSVFMSFGVANGTSVESVREYKNAMDGFAIDRYPVGGGFPENYGAMWQVAVANINARNLANQEGLDFFYTCIQAFQDLDHPTNPLRLPTYNETRYLVYSAVIHDSDGALFWTGGREEGGNSTPLSHRANIVNPIVQEIDSLMYAINHESNDFTVSSSRDNDTNNRGINDVTYFLGETSNAYYLFTMSNMYLYPYSVRFDLGGLPNVSSTVEVLNENRSVTMSQNGTNGYFIDNFGTYDVNIYKISKIMQNPD